MSSAEAPTPAAAALAQRLDEDHYPQTNGRMAVCRRCGFRTMGDMDVAHAPVDGQESRANRWLDAQAHANRIAMARGAVDT